MGSKSGSKERLDILMVTRGLAESREKAKRLVLAGQVIVAGIDLPKPGQVVESTVEITLKEKERYVSRGGLKLEHALTFFGINLTGRTCADIGASTGGFTDCMLQHQAARVYSVDVGASQMHEKVRSDPRVTLLEHTNARGLTRDMFETQPDFAAVDVSFISVLRVSAPLFTCLAEGGETVFLIKPQFEAGREAVSRGKGVIKDAAVHRAVLESVLTQLSEQGWFVSGLTYSPIAGGSGNVEFLCRAVVNSVGDRFAWGERIDIDDIIRSAGAHLK